MKKIEIIYKNNLLTLNLFSLFFSLNFLSFPFYFKLLYYVWFPKSTKEKNVKENDFLMFGCPIKHSKKN